MVQKSKKREARGWAFGSCAGVTLRWRFDDKVILEVCWADNGVGLDCCKPGRSICKTVARAWRLWSNCSLAERLPLLRDSRQHTPHLPLVLIFTACHNHVAAVRCQVCDEEVVAQQLDEAIGKLVRQCGGLQTARTEVRIFFLWPMATLGYFWVDWTIFGALGNGFLTSCCPQGRWLDSRRKWDRPSCSQAPTTKGSLWPCVPHATRISGLQTY